MGQPTKNKITIEDSKPKNGGLFIALVAVAIVLIIGFVIPILLSGNNTNNTVPVPGDASSFLLIESLPEILTWAGKDAQIINLRAFFVKSDGTMDLNAEYNTRVSLEIVQTVAGNTDLPLGAGGSQSGVAYERSFIEMSRPGETIITRSGSSTTQYVMQGMILKPFGVANTDEGVDLPTCTFRELWEVALTEDFPADAVATIEYGGETYNMKITGTDFDLTFNKDCEVVR